MPIKPISGEIESQPLNDNFSYLDSEVLNLKDALVGETTLTYTNGVVTQIETPFSTITLDYVDGEITKVTEIESERTIETTFNYVDGELDSINREVME